MPIPFVAPSNLWISAYNCGNQRMNLHTILVVEDDPNDESLTLRALRGVKKPCSVVVARTGGDALDFLFRRGAFVERASADPDVVFMDNTLPGVPGNELVRKIRDDATLSAVKLVVFSGSSDGALIQRCLDAGANAFLEKPVDMVEYVDGLRAAAERWLAA